MPSNFRPFVLPVILAFTGCTAHIDANPTVPLETSVMHTMVSVITPASDVLWAAYDPQSEEEWNKLEDAARRVLETGNAIKLGATGPQDNDWINQAEWQVFATAMTDAATQYLDAIDKKDASVFFDAGDALYSPCEGCHLQFNPAVTGQ